ncbi:MAG: BolA family transcriptional regulator [Candidatus Marinimicrobia bacterium]|nr:BolA family transcriptional regulator [Candidatus Neomarinimicrobiota bacterium]
MSIEEIIRKKFDDSNLSIHHFELKDFTGRHLNHELHSGGFHLEAIIVSEDFVGKNLIDRHKMVYSALGNLMQNEIHALSMKTLTIKEWN